MLVSLHTNTKLKNQNLKTVFKKKTVIRYFFGITIFKILIFQQKKISLKLFFEQSNFFSFQKINQKLLKKNYLLKSSLALLLALKLSRKFQCGTSVAAGKYTMDVIKVVVYKWAKRGEPPWKRGFIEIHSAERIRGPCGYSLSPFPFSPPHPFLDPLGLWIAFRIAPGSH